MNINPFLHQLPDSASAIQLPDRFTFPFCYKPHELAKLASLSLQEKLMKQLQWQHGFDFSDSGNSSSGKMFGVLVVENQAGELGYLSAYSGKLNNDDQVTGFVPPVFNGFNEDEFFTKKQQIINNITDEITELESSENYIQLIQQYGKYQEEKNTEIEALQALIREQRKDRKAKRKALINDENSQQVLKQLANESIAEKKQLQQLKDKWQTLVFATESKLTALDDDIKALKKQRKKLSSQLQKRLFKQYTFLNYRGETKNIAELFEPTPYKVPPAGAGECAAPKLLQFAYLHKLKPITMAEFWWGASPKSQVRKHKHFYPACYSKCQPILPFMLEGLTVDDNPLLTNHSANKTIDILYQDQDIIVINKPAELLSVPGKLVADSVYARIKAMFPQAQGAIIVHRLDMSTSGLMVLTLTSKANKLLQKQFIARSVEKRYVALLDGTLKEKEGTISLPLMLDFDDKPRQMVCFDNGKPAETYYQVVEEKEGKTLVYFYPKTGRTHQLRVHAAHHLGLNTPIVGDDHYGRADSRLHLHAERLKFIHPVTKKEMCFCCPAEFNRP